MNQNVKSQQDLGEAALILEGKLKQDGGVRMIGCLIGFVAVAIVFFAGFLAGRAWG